MSQEPFINHSPLDEDDQNIAGTYIAYHAPLLLPARQKYLSSGKEHPFGVICELDDKYTVMLLCNLRSDHISLMSLPDEDCNAPGCFIKHTRSFIAHAPEVIEAIAGVADCPLCTGANITLMQNADFNDNLPIAIITKEIVAFVEVPIHPTGFIFMQ